MREIKNCCLIWNDSYLASVKRLSNDGNGNARYRITIFFRYVDLVITDIRKSCIDLTKNNNALSIINQMIDESCEKGLYK